MDSFYSLIFQQKSYTLPDGSTIRIGAAAYQAPEVLFRPDLIGAEYTGVPQCIANAIKVCFWWVYLTADRLAIRLRTSKGTVNECLAKRWHYSLPWLW